MRPISYQAIGGSTAKIMEIGNRAYLYGETVFTTLRTFKGKPLFLDRHRNRLLQGGAFLWPWITDLATSVDRKIEEFFSASIKTDLRVRITLSVNQVLPALSKEGGVLCLHIDTEEIPPLEFHPRGIRLKTSISRRSKGVLPGFLKKGNYLESIIERRALANYDEILFLTDREEVAEASTSNIFILKGGNIITPPTSSMVLEGTVRGALLSIVEDSKEGIITYPDLMNAEAVWLTRSSAFIVPVYQIDKQIYPSHQIHRELFDKIYGEVCDE